MLSINRKLLRDLRGLRGQALAIGSVIVAGVASFVSMTSTIDTLEHTLEVYYDEYRFPHGFAQVARAPERVAERLRTVEGIGVVQTRITALASLEIEGFDEPVRATIHSLSEGRQPVLNRLHLREGRLIAPGREDEVLVTEVFAEAHALRAGDAIGGIVHGSQRRLTIVGIVLTPEHLWQVEPGALFSDPETYGVLWMGRAALAAAVEMEGAFNDVAFTLAPRASLEDVIQRVDLVLERYGGRGAFGRDDHPSHRLVSLELEQLRGTATLLPVLFLAVAAFLLNLVVMRMVALQRQQIAVLKAFGYRDRDVGAHYLKLVLLIALLGAAGGVLAGIWMGGALAGLYLEFFRFPRLDYLLRPAVVLAAVVLTLGAALLGVVQAVRRAVRLPPAEAMRPAPPAAFRPTVIERLGLQRWFSQPTRIVMRNIERAPLKSAFSVFGIAVAGALLIMGLFFRDSFDHIIEVQYGIAQREHVRVGFVGPSSVAAAHELRALRGVLHVEPFRVVPVRLRHGHRSYAIAIEGIPPDAYLRQVIDDRLRPVPIPRDGVVLAEGLAQLLGAAPGDVLTVEVLEGRRLTRTMPVAGVTTQFIGIGAYVDLAAAHRLAGGGSAISGALLLIDSNEERAIHDALQDRPRVASVLTTDRAIRAFREESAAIMLIFAFILTLFAGTIAFGVVYNSIRISLSERDRELASLRVLGFTRGEIAYILLGEAAALVLLAIPLGFVLGSFGAMLTVMSVETDIMTIPLVLTRRTFTLSAIVVLGSALLSALLIGRKLYRLDLIGVLKSRE